MPIRIIFVRTFAVAATIADAFAITAFALKWIIAWSSTTDLIIRLSWIKLGGKLLQWFFCLF